MSINKITLGPEITIGMSAYGNYQTTREALIALFASAEGDYELILVDDCSPDNTRELFLETRKVHPNTRVLGFDSNKEYSGSLNAILSEACGDFIIFLSNDIFVTPSYLHALLAVAQKDKRHGIVRGCSNFVDNGLDTHNISLPKHVDNWAQLAEFAAGIEADFGDAHLKDPFLTGDAFLVSRELINRIGTFDPLFFGYFADHDYGIRARIAGFDLVLARGAYALHKRNANFEYLPSGPREEKLKRRWAKIHENWARFKLKYDMPVELPYTDIRTIDWDALGSAEFDSEKYYSAPRDYSSYQL